jgi:hypothetical protein
MHHSGRSAGLGAAEPDTDGDEGSVREYLDIIALLEQEVNRLEHELRFRSEQPHESDPPETAGNEDAGASPSPGASAADAEAEVQRLERELAKGQETVALLLDQLSLLEEAKAANQAEWEQMAAWVSELERRVEGQDSGALAALQAQLAEKDRAAEELRAQSEQQRRSWEIQRQVQEGEIARLQRALADGGAAPPRAADDDRQGDPAGERSADLASALEEEISRLRARHEIIERTAAEESALLHSRLSAAQGERDTLRFELKQAEEEQKRQKLEYEASIAELRSRLKEVSLIQPDAAPRANERQGHSADLDADFRVRALRQHLLEIHEREEEERRERNLKNRLSRLWSRTTRR